MEIHYLTNLGDDTTYHYRYVATDERGNTIYSPDKTLTTATPPNVVYVPGAIPGPPYHLTSSNKNYVVTQDIVADGTAIEVEANNVTLDLGGHTITYNNTIQLDPTGPRGDFWDFMEFACMGIRVYNQDSVNVVNGFIKQGLGNNGAEVCGIGYSPFYIYSTDGEIAGLSVEYTGRQVSGIATKWSGPNNIHHNVVKDRGGRVWNRQMSIHGIGSARYNHHNLVKRVRHCGIAGGDNLDVYSNEVYVDSCDTNSFAVTFYSADNSECWDNKLFGTGYLAVGVSTVSGSTDIEVHDNFVHMEEMEPDTRSSEYGAQSGGYCCRITWGGDNIDYHDNVMVTYGRDGGMVRGTWFYTQSSTSNVFFRDNIVKAILRNMASDIQGAIVVAGDGDDYAPPPHVYENNRIISNFCNVRFGESYGTGNNTRFYDNTFVKEGPSRTDYRTIQCGYSVPTKNHELYDSSFEGGASYEEYTFPGSGAPSSFFKVGWTLTVETEPLAHVTIKDYGANVVFDDLADGSGIVQTRLVEYKQNNTSKSYYTPHSVKAEKDGVSDTKSVTMSCAKTIQIPLVQTYTLTVNSGTGSGDYEEGEVVAIAADTAPSGTVFDKWVGDTAGIADVNSSSTTITMPAAAAEITATYLSTLYTLTVNSGSGSGSYAAGAVVSISADSAPTGKKFWRWTGDTSGIADNEAASTTLTMPAGSTEVTATYTYTGDLNLDGVVGQTDLDVVLDDWGQSVPPADPRADPSGDNFVGQVDLDYVLDDWGEGY